MRKQDYATLAQHIREGIAQWPVLTTLAARLSEESIIKRMAVAEQSARTARFLAQNLHVDKAEFLKACGLKP